MKRYEDDYLILQRSTGLLQDISSKKKSLRASFSKVRHRQLFWDEAYEHPEVITQGKQFRKGSKKVIFFKEISRCESFFQNVGMSTRSQYEDYGREFGLEISLGLVLGLVLDPPLSILLRPHTRKSLAATIFAQAFAILLLTDTTLKN